MEYPILESEAIEKGFYQLSGKEILEKITRKQIRGNYLYGYKYIGVFHPDGTTEGENNVGAHPFGEYVVNLESNTLSLFWDSGWDNTTTRAYDVNGEIHFYDISTGNWRMSFIEFSDIVSDAVTYHD